MSNSFSVSKLLLSLFLFIATHTLVNASWHNGVASRTLKKTAKQSLTETIKENKEDILEVSEACGKAYGVVLASAIGHEFGHVALPYLYGSQVKIGVAPSLKGLFCRWAPPLPKRLELIAIGVGPIAGIATTFGILKAANVYREYNKWNSDKTLKKAISQGLKKPMVRDSRDLGLGLGASFACIINALNYTKWWGKGSDGHQITERLKLSRGKAIAARTAMTLGALGLAGYTLDKK